VSGFRGDYDQSHNIFIDVTILIRWRRKISLHCRCIWRFSFSDNV